MTETDVVDGGMFAINMLFIHLGCGFTSEIKSILNPLTLVTTH